MHQAVGLAGIERFVDHIPRINLGAEVLHLILNVLLDVRGHEGLIGRGVGSVARGIGRRLRAGGPHQVVPANAHVVAHRESHLASASAKVKEPLVFSTELHFISLPGVMLSKCFVSNCACGPERSVGSTAAPIGKSPARVWKIEGISV